MLFAAAYLAYRSTSEDELIGQDGLKKHQRTWKDRLSDQFNDIRNSPPVRNALRCYENQIEDTLDSTVVLDSSMESQSSSSTYSDNKSSMFSDAVRQEWIQAVFGTDFPNMEGDSFPPPGVGLASISPYASYRVRIPAQIDCDKLGITLSRLALGLYVKHVEPGSEAWSAGIKAGSVLVDLNGMSLLAEPSKQALERIWQYDGKVEYYDDGSETFSEQSNFQGSNGQGSMPGGDINGCAKLPLSMTLIFGGKIYSVIMLGNSPSGIEWAPCGNFALVKKAYSVGANAGVKQGSIVAAVNKKTIYDLDHAGAANALRSAFLAKKELNLQFCLPPADSRPSHYEKMFPQLSPQPTPRPKVSIDHEGVQVRVHPIRWKSPDHPKGPDVVAKLACRISAGENQPVPRRMRRSRQKIFGPCPSLSDEDLFKAWDAWTALYYCMHYHHIQYDERQMNRIDPTASARQMVMKFCSDAENADIVGCFLLQCLSLSYWHQQEDQEEPMKELELKQTEINEEKKCDMAPNNKCNDEFGSAFLHLADSDDKFGEHIYFLLQSFVADEGANRSSLQSLLHSVKRVRSAQSKQEKAILVEKPKVAQQPLKDEKPEQPEQPPSLLPLSPGSNSSSIVNDQPVTVAMDKQNLSKPQKTRRRMPKAIFGLFRKKKAPSKRSSAAHVTQPIQSKAKLCPQETLTIKNNPSTEEPMTISVASAKAPKIASGVQVEPDQPTFSRSVLHNNMMDFLQDLEDVCLNIEGSLQRSVPQKIAEWALQPWSASKENILGQATSEMRERLHDRSTVLSSPLDSSELFTSLNTSECYILPSAHFPLLLTFNCTQARCERLHQRQRSKKHQERLYHTTVELVSLNIESQTCSDDFRSFVVHGAVSGTVLESGSSVIYNTDHRWEEGNILRFDNRSCWGGPKTLSIRVGSINNGHDGKDISVVSDSSNGRNINEEGYCWIDLDLLWNKLDVQAGRNESVTICSKVLAPDDIGQFDDHGDLQTPSSLQKSKNMKLTLKVTTEVVELSDSSRGAESRTTLLLYKHDDDLRRESFAIQYVRACDNILRACGLDLKLLTFECIPVGKKRGFIEWVPGSVPLSEICQTFASSILSRKKDVVQDIDPLSARAKAGLAKYQSLLEVHGSSTKSKGLKENPIQDYLRSVAYHPDHPYMIRKDVMDTYVKSCAGYCVVTYLLGVGDRHLDNLLLHQTGHFFHCDYSFILGKDPKKYLPMRITEDMVQGMGGRDSDNFALFLSLTSTAFLALRRPENVRYLLSLVRLMERSAVLGPADQVENAIISMRERFKLEMNQDQAIAFMENLIESSLSSKMWIAVDAIHTLGKRF